VGCQRKYLKRDVVLIIRCPLMGRRCPRPERELGQSHAAARNSLPAVLYLYITKEIAMHITNLRKVGGSVMLAVPPALLDILHLQPGAKVGIAIESGRLVVEPQNRPRYTMDELLAQCDPKASRNAEDRAWLKD